MNKTPGSNRRQRPLILTARVSPEEKKVAAAKAKDYPGGISEMFRVSVLNMRPRPSQIDREAFAKTLASFGEAATLLRNGLNNLNQLTKYANMGKTLEGSIQVATDEMKDAVREVEDHAAQLMHALGFNRRRSNDD